MTIRRTFQAGVSIAGGRKVGGKWVRADDLSVPDLGALPPCFEFKQVA